MLKVGEQLRCAREEQKLSVQQIAEITKMRSDQVLAVEEGRLDSFAAPVYVRGFVRAYAEAVKLPLPPLLEELNAELGKSDKFKEAAGGGPPNRGVLDAVMLQLSRANLMIILPMVVILFLLAGGYYTFRYWQRQGRADPLSELGSGLRQVRPQPEYLAIPTNAAPKR